MGSKGQSGSNKKPTSFLSYVDMIPKNELTQFMPIMQSRSLGVFSFARASSRNNDLLCHYENFPGDFVQLKKQFKARLQISFLTLSEIKRINKLVLPLRSPENLWLTYGFLVIPGEIEANQSKCPSKCLLLF